MAMFCRGHCLVVGVPGGLAKVDAKWLKTISDVLH
jgi:hypothetical protein